MASSLNEFKKKRKLNRTPEPADGKPSGSRLRFVVQKHAASRLHYDFRLEMGGVLKSWAVPKGPSMNPSDKRLAMLVEDHPYDYLDFEGIIPKDNYGAGTVIVWDQGTYEPAKAENAIKEEQEKFMTKAFEKGSITVHLNGQKLKGEFVLRRNPAREENEWLLFKRRDAYANDKNKAGKDISVISGRTLEEVAADKDAPTWNSHRSGEAEKTVAAKIIRSVTGKSQENAPDQLKQLLMQLLKGKPKSAFPAAIEPMLAKLVDKPVEGEWLYEVKWDGFRALAYKLRDQVDLRSRNNKSFNDKFYPVFQALTEWEQDIVVDGEIVVLNRQGLPDFEALQTWRSEADGKLVYFVFDVLWLKGISLMETPLTVRREILRKVLPGNDTIRMSDDFDAGGNEFFKLIDSMGLEGMVAKKKNSLYEPGRRSGSWLKIKTQKFQETVIGGYTINENTTRKFSALLTGVFEKGELIFTGAVGTGFSEKVQEDILRRLKPLEIAQCPFREVPEYNKPSRFRPNPPKADVVWVKPQIVAEIAYRTVAPDGSFRHPSFKGLRDDKSANEVVREKAVSIREATDGQSTLEKKIRANKGTEDRKTLLNPTEETQTREIGGRTLRIPNLSKVYWPEERITKRDMLNYYYQVAPIMLPYLKDRPQTMNRFPNGIYGKSFYQKDVTGKVPAWLQTFRYYSEADQREKQFPVCSDEASLLYIASLGCIEINPWSSRIQSPDYPDWCVIDLDPDQNPFEQVIETAQVVRGLLEALGIPGYCKTSGSTGLHIYIPLGAKYTYEESREFGRAFARNVNSILPAFTSIERLTSRRKGRIYIDFLQNRPQATVAGPYSLRPKPGAPVSMPLHWEEVKKGLSIRDFTIFNVIGRIKEQGDIFAGVLGKGIDMDTALLKIRDIQS